MAAGTGVQTAREALLAEALADAGALLERLDKVSQSLPALAEKTTADIGSAADAATMAIAKTARQAAADLQGEHKQYQKTLQETATALRTAAGRIDQNSRRLAMRIITLGALAGALSGGLGAIGCVFLARHFGVL